MWTLQPSWDYHALYIYNEYILCVRTHTHTDINLPSDMLVRIYRTGFLIKSIKSMVWYVLNLVNMLIKNSMFKF